MYLWMMFRRLSTFCDKARDRRDFKLGDPSGILNSVLTLTGIGLLREMPISRILGKFVRQFMISILTDIYIQLYFTIVYGSLT